jgi:hypothetical protein
MAAERMPQNITIKEIIDCAVCNQYYLRNRRSTRMRISLGRRILGVGLVLAFSGSTLMAETGAAMLYANGPVAVNGAGVSRASTVFAGDTIETRTGGVTIALKGSTVVVPANSSLVFRGQTVEVGEGGAEINTTNGMAAKMNAFTVSPAANGSAKYEIASVDGKLLVAAKRGAVVLSDENGSTVVQEGTTKTANDEPAPPDQSQKKKKKKGGAAPIPGATGAAVSGKALMIAGAGAATAGIILAIVTTGQPESPTRP